MAENSIIVFPPVSELDSHQMHKCTVRFPINTILSLLSSCDWCLMNLPAETLLYYSYENMRPEFGLGNCVCVCVCVPLGM